VVRSRRSSLPGRPAVSAAAILGLGLSVLLASPAADGGYDIIQYGKDCARLIAEVPPFDCRDGEIIPITVDGKEPEHYSRNMTCDKPAYLPYPAKTDGQCVPWTRIRVARDDDVQMVLYCRRMYIRPKDSPFFDSFEIIMHNVTTGSTCFFISKNFGEKPEGDDGRRVPPPDEETPPEGMPAARDVWATPQQTADDGCIFCHDSDPWMHTPWIAQTDQLPADPWGYHSVDVGGPFAAWPKPQSIRTRGNPCNGCHRIGSLNTCGARDIPTFGEQPAKMLQAVGQAPHGRFGAKPGAKGEPGLTTAWGAHPHGWMGTRLPDADTDLWASYEADVRDLQRCCKDHSAPGCIIEPIEGKAAWLTRETATKSR